MKEIRVGLIGLGTVGTGVADILLRNGGLIEGRPDLRLHLARIADLDITSDRGISIPDGVLTTDVKQVIENPDIDIVVELVGGTTIAKNFILDAIAAGKPVVTANKALLAYHGAEIFAAAESKGVDVYYEASVAGGIPIIKGLREGLVANRIHSIYGILNGTCNYILTRMEQEHVAFDDVLKEAQNLGYAETNPDLDINGDDTAHKISILASLAYGTWYGMDPIHIEGIAHLELQDILNAAEAGYRIKLLGIIKQDQDRVQLRVHPALVPKSSIMAQVNDVFNAVSVSGDFVGDTVFIGRGAGRDPTASAVVADLVDVGLNLGHGCEARVPGFRPRDGAPTPLDMDDIVTRYYLRFQVEDHPNVLARISGVIGGAGISIASITQKESHQGDSVPIVIITDLARNSDIRRALAKAEALDAVTAPPVRIRIEDI